MRSSQRRRRQTAARHPAAVPRSSPDRVALMIDADPLGPGRRCASHPGDIPKRSSTTDESTPSPATTTTRTTSSTTASTSGPLSRPVRHPGLHPLPSRRRHVSLRRTQPAGRRERGCPAPVGERPQGSFRYIAHPAPPCLDECSTYRTATLIKSMLPLWAVGAGRHQRGGIAKCAGAAHVRYGKRVFASFSRRCWRLAPA